MVTGLIEAGLRAEGLILAGQCPARQAAAIMEAAATAAAGRPVEDRAEATPEADPMAALLAADTTTTK